MNLKFKNILLLLLIFVSTFIFKTPAKAIILELNQPLTNDFISNQNLNSEKTKKQIITLVRFHTRNQETDLEKELYNLANNPHLPLEDMSINCTNKHVCFVSTFKCSTCNLQIQFNDKTYEIILKGLSENVESIITASQLPFYRPKKSFKNKKIKSLTPDSQISDFIKTESEKNH